MTDGSNYDYAVPELSSAPLLSKRPCLLDHIDSLSDRMADSLSNSNSKEDGVERACNSANSVIRASHSRLDVRVLTIMFIINKSLEYKVNVALHNIVSSQMMSNKTQLAVYCGTNPRV